MANRMTICLACLDTKHAAEMTKKVKAAFETNGKTRVLVKLTKKDGSSVYYRNGSDYCDGYDEKATDRSIWYYVDDFANLFRCADFYGKRFPVMDVVRVC